jgi:hypothetical protein
MNSREYAKFKRTFVGPILPKRIKKERGIGIPPAMPALKPPRSDCKIGTTITIPGIQLVDPDSVTSGHKPTNDWRSVRYGLNLKSFITPAWANKEAIKDIYNEAKKLTLETGIRYQVDHIIPVRHPLVCGLHVENNLRVLPADDNNQKSNSFEI